MSEKLEADQSVNERPWLAHYPPGVPHDIDPAQLPTLADLFETSVARFGDRVAFESFGKQFTYRQFETHVRDLAAALQRMGLNRGDRVAVMMPNIAASPVVLFALIISGYTVVNVNPLYTPPELARQINDSGARMIIIADVCAHTLDKALEDCVKLERAVLVRLGDLLGAKGIVVNFVARHVRKIVPAYHLPLTHSFKSFLEWGARERAKTPLERVDIQPDDVAFLQYTGGTTGVSKGAMLTHRNVAANVLQAEAWLAPSLDPDAQHVMYTALPLYHILALTACCLFMLRIGAAQVLVPNPRDLPALIALMKERPPTMLVMVNTLYNALARHPDIAQADLSKLALCISGGMATQASVAKRWKELTGKPIVEGYGLSETSPLVSVNRLDIEEFTGTIGYPVSSTFVRIIDADGAPVAPDEAGELCVKGPQVTQGYFEHPEETAHAFTPDGYFRTGDIAVMNADGSLKIIDRLKDMIVVSGLKVFPNEVEDVLANHPKVLEAAVVGEPDEHSGESVSAFVTAKDPSLTADELRAFAREALAPYKIPRRIEFRDELPKSNVGKILRRQLRPLPAQDETPPPD
ncbi:MAG: AMP-binding protein [Beijerinckiaceae bacterium]|nr:AMP-binding protein [Beijerinckiaceae bacterium]